MSYAKGYNPDPIEKRTQKDAAVHLALLEGDAATSATNEKHEPLCEDQGQVGSCTGHGTSGGIVVSAAGADWLSCVPSPKIIYALGRLQGAPGQPLEDQGANPSDVMAAISTYGILPMGASVEGRNSDCSPSNRNDEPQLGELEKSGTKIVVGEYRIDEKAPNMAALVAAAIAKGYAVGIGVFVDSAFEDWGSNWSESSVPLHDVDLQDPNGGGHWVFLDAFQKLADGSYVFSGLNSWGLGWGAPALLDAANCKNPYGHFRVTDGWLEKSAMDIYVLSVAPKAPAATDEKAAA